VVPLNVEVPVAAGGDLSLRDDADVDVIGSQLRFKSASSLLLQRMPSEFQVIIQLFLFVTLLASPVAVATI
jgi:hypothetical protein